MPLLENDERLEDAIEFLVHNLECSLHLVKWEGMGRHERGIDARDMHEVPLP